MTLSMRKAVQARLKDENGKPLVQDGDWGEKTQLAIYNLLVPEGEAPEASGTLPLRQRLVDIARKDEGKTEDTRNRAAYIKAYWPATSYPEGYDNREPYCAAAVCYWVREWLKDPEVLAALKMTATEADKWRGKSAAAFGWREWANDKGATILKATDKPRAGDIAVYEFSHIGIVISASGDDFKAIEANTGATGQREGEGVFVKSRNRDAVRSFIRLLA